MNLLSAGLVIGTRELAEEMHSVMAELPVRILLEQRVLGDLAVLLGKLEQVRVDVLIVEITGLTDRLEEVFRKIAASPTAPTVVALHGSADPDLIVAAMRGGANEFVYPPLKENIRTALDRITTRLAQQQRTRSAGARTLGFLSAKGGCGATTIACHLAVEFQRQTQHRILLADFDTEAGLVGFYLKSKSSYSVLDAANNVHRLDLSFWRALISNGMPRLELITAPPTRSAGEALDEEAFRHVVRFARPHYDWILVDLGRGLRPLSMNVLEEMDESFVVTTLDVPALYQAKQVVQTLLETGYGNTRLHILVNRMPKRSEVTLDEVQKMLGLPAYAVLPNDYPALYEAYAGGGLVPAGTHLGGHFSRLAATIAGISEDKAKGKRKFSLFG